MDLMHTVRAWRTIENYLSLISDPFLAAALRHELTQWAKKEWGYCPGDTQTYKDNQDIPELEPWEQEFVDRVNAYLEYGVDVMTEEEKQRADTVTLNNMIDFINKGHTYWDIPEDIQCESLKEIYDKAFDIVFDVEKFTKSA